MKLVCEKAKQQPGEDDREHRGQAESQRGVRSLQSSAPRRDRIADRQVAAVDVRVPEQRVDAEVEVEVVGGLELRRSRRCSPRGAGRCRSGRGSPPPPTSTAKARREQPAVPADLGEQREQHGERDQEEADVARGEGDVGRVDRLDRVEADTDHQSEHAAVSGRACARAVCPRRVATTVASTPDADHDVERDEQVDGLPPATCEPESGRAGSRHQQGQEHRPAEHGGRADREADDGRRGSPPRTRADGRAGSAARPSPVRRSGRPRAHPRPPAPPRADAGRTPRRSAAATAPRREAARSPPARGSRGSARGAVWMTRCSPEVAIRSASLKLEPEPVGAGRTGLPAGIARPVPVEAVRIGLLRPPASG